MNAYPCGTKRAMYGASGTEPGSYPLYSISVGKRPPSLGSTTVYFRRVPSRTAT